MILAFFAAFAAMPECCVVRVHVRSAAGLNLESATVQAGVVKAETTRNGQAELQLKPGLHEFLITKEGFSPARRQVAITANVAAMDFTLAAIERQSITVTDHTPDDPVSAAGAALTPEQTRLLPADPPSVRDALPLIPGIVRGPTGNLTLSGSPEYRSTFQINGLDVTDPASGAFGRTVPIDSVAILNVYRSPFLTEFGRFGTDVVAVETKRGGEKWAYELNDPTPEFRIRTRRIVGIRGFTPRFSYGGPLRRNKLYFTQSLEYALRKVPSFTLPFPNNEERQEGWNVLTQFDYLPSARQWLTVTLHGAPQHIRNVRPGFYNPITVTPHYRSHEYRGALSHKWTIAGGLLESAFAGAQVWTETSGQGTQPLFITPTQNLGNYFFDQTRQADRWQWRETWTPAVIARRGAHQPKLGITAARVLGTGLSEARPFIIEGFPPVTFRNQLSYRLPDTDLGGFVQDHWILNPQLSLDFGIRTDWQQRTGRTRTAPESRSLLVPVERAPHGPPRGLRLVLRSRPAERLHVPLLARSQQWSQHPR